MQQWRETERDVERKEEKGETVGDALQCCWLIAASQVKPSQAKSSQVKFMMEKIISCDLMSWIWCDACITLNSKRGKEKRGEAITMRQDRWKFCRAGMCMDEETKRRRESERIPHRETSQFLGFLSSDMQWRTNKSRTSQPPSSLRLLRMHT